VIGVTVLLASSIGFIEDLRGLRVATRASLQVILGMTAAIAIGATLDASWWAVAAGAILIAAYINVANFMDGINGISALHGLVVGSTFVVIGALQSIDWLVAVGGVVAIVFTAFLTWNLRRPSLFLGDVGSYMLGSAVATMAITAAFAGVPVLTIIAPLSIYLADTGFTLLRRIRHGERWHQAHRTHVYQRLTESGRSHVKVALYVATMTALCSAAGIAALYASGPVTVLVSVALIVVVLTYMLTPKILNVLRKDAS
jgi:UDP-N-acetylmuramyl pentapeptide phosphotransferase/UDP-N-acetylglucosamine-1-phosphate transferase